MKKYRVLSKGMETFYSKGMQFLSRKTAHDMINNKCGEQFIKDKQGVRQLYILTSVKGGFLKIAVSATVGYCSLAHSPIISDL